MLAVTLEEMLFLGVSALIVFLLLAFYFWYSWRENDSDILSLYSKKPLRRGSDVYWVEKEKVLKYLYKKHDYANRIFDFKKAVLCRETGRIFPDCVTWWGAIKLDWTFLNKRYPENFVSWGSLSKDQQDSIRDKHPSIDGYQTYYSSQNPSPQRVEMDYAMMKPGPLYADPETGILIGWKCVPDTDLEVLIVQRPVERYLPGIHKKY